jgi:hypothetical protein
MANWINLADSEGRQVTISEMWAARLEDEPDAQQVTSFGCGVGAISRF